MPKQVKPLRKSVAAKPHRPVYRMHRYFARRPYSVFSELVRHYSDPGDVILDPFMGGGVTLVEGVLQEKSVIGFDLNPLATFVTRMEVEAVDLKGLQTSFDSVVQRYSNQSDRIFATDCRECGQLCTASWFEHSARTDCSVCGHKIIIASAEKESAGVWKCTNCNAPARFSPTAETTFELINVYYECKSCGGCGIAVATPNDEIHNRQIESELSAMESQGLWIPNDPIPDCNMQRESALFKKGIFKFRQLFTYRHLLALGLLRKHILQQPLEYRDWLLFTFSSTLRYTNRMVTRNPVWRGERPLEWAKPGFWLPPVHLEANVLIEYSRRFDALKRGKQDFQAKLPRTITVHKNPTQVLDDELPSAYIGTHSSTDMPLPDRSVDLILTDPPYGSYVHYADLSNFWSVWLPEIESMGGVIDNAEEAVIARKKFPGAKTASDYQDLLERCFTECARVLKPEGYMVLTFNNREPRAWAALLLAATKAGFELPAKGIIFQDGVPSYRHTAQSRRLGSVIGDFIISFMKADPHSLSEASAPDKGWTAERELIKTLTKILTVEGPLTPSELIAQMYSDFCPKLLRQVKSAIKQGDIAKQRFIEEFDAIQLFDSHRRQLLEEYFVYLEGEWHLKDQNERLSAAAHSN